MVMKLRRGEDRYKAQGRRGPANEGREVCEGMREVEWGREKEKERIDVNHGPDSVACMG